MTSVAEKLLMWYGGRQRVCVVQTVRYGGINAILHTGALGTGSVKPGHCRRRKAHERAGATQ